MVTFTISYTPVEYGKIKTGTLIIQTPEYYWSFTLKGTFPKYVPPKLEKGQLDNKLDPNLLAKFKSEQKSKLSTLHK
jgi:hypothetical protein